MEPKREPAGNLKGKFAGWLARGLRSLLAPLAFNSPGSFPSLRPSGQRYPPCSSIPFSPAVIPSPGFILWIPPKICLPLTIMMISKQSHRMSRISFRRHPSPDSVPFLHSGKSPVVRGARACTVCRAAKVGIPAYPIPKFVSH